MIWFYWTVAFLSHIIPYRIAIFITKRIADCLYFTLYRGARIPVNKNLERIYGRTLKPWERKEFVLKIFRNFGVFIYEFLILPRVYRKGVLKFAEPIHKERLEEIIKNKKGVIVLTGHLGNWELGACVLSSFGLSPTVIALAHPSKRITDFFTARRSKTGMRVIYIGGGLKKIILALKNGNVVATLGDRDYVGTGILHDFMGEKIFFPRGVFEIAQRLKVPIIPAFCVKVNNKYKVFFEIPIYVDDINDGIRKWSKILEVYVRRFPTQWYIFDPIWYDENSHCYTSI
jgi:KDO2-lipid IV(A) lauroyltransferase